MKNTTTHRRCVECSGEFIADPRVGERQVTCGAEGCQRARHAERCRDWHASNAESREGHYRDVVVPFRQQQPDYQRRWRWRRRLREIREQTGLLGEVMLGRLRALSSGAEQLLARAAGVVQTGVLAGESLSRAVRAVRSAIGALEQLEASGAEFRALGL